MYRRQKGKYIEKICKYTIMVGFKIRHESFDSIFYWNNVVGEDTYSMYTKIWREDIVVPYVTTYAVPLRTRAHAYTIM